MFKPLQADVRIAYGTSGATEFPQALKTIPGIAGGNIARMGEDGNGLGGPTGGDP